METLPGARRGFRAPAQGSERPRSWSISSQRRNSESGTGLRGHTGRRYGRPAPAPEDGRAGNLEVPGGSWRFLEVPGGSCGLRWSSVKALARRWGKETISGGGLDNRQFNEFVPATDPLAAALAMMAVMFWPGGTPWPMVDVNRWLLVPATIVEFVFGYPGIGQALVEAVANRDLPMVQAVSVLIAAVYVGVNILADLATILFTPRLRTSYG